MKTYEDGDSRLRLRGGSVLSLACRFTERHPQKEFLGANESREHALNVKKKSGQKKIVRFFSNLKKKPKFFKGKFFRLYEIS